MSKKCIIMAAGGTGGHLFPAQAIARELLAKQKDLELYFISPGLKKNPFFYKKLFSFYEISSATLFQKKLVVLTKVPFVIMKGIYQALKLLKRLSPNLVVGFGSFHSFPTLFAAYLLRIPIILFEGNMMPGRVIRLFSRVAICTALFMEGKKEQVKGKTVSIKMPLWNTVEVVSKEKALSYYGLQEGIPTILVFGGSQGALSINHCFCQTFPLLYPSLKNFQVIHIIGKKERVEKLQKVYHDLNITAAVKNFEKKMNFAWNAADLAVCRSGAGSIAEQLAFEVPSILIPYPYATNEHQDKNAEFMVHEVKGALSIKEVHLTPEHLSALLLEVFNKRKEMHDAIKRYKEITQKEDLVTIIENRLLK